MFQCKNCGNKNKETLEEIKPIPPYRNYNFIEVLCKICNQKSLIHVDD